MNSDINNEYFYLKLKKLWIEIDDREKIISLVEKRYNQYNELYLASHQSEDS